MERAAMDLVFNGDKELAIQFRGLPNAVKKKLLTHALKIGANVVLDKARAIAPVKSGALRDGMNVQKLKRNRKRWGFLVLTPTREELAKGQPTAEKAEQVYSEPGYYPAVMEFGSKRVAPRPYLRPALELSESQIIAMAAQDIREALNGKPRENESDGDEGGIDPDKDLAPDAPVHVGERGGKYRLSKTGGRVYLRK